MKKYKARRSNAQEIYRDRERACRAVWECDRNEAGEDIIRAERQAIVRDMMRGLNRWGGFCHG